MKDRDTGKNAVLDYVLEKQALNPCIVGELQQESVFKAARMVALSLCLFNFLQFYF